RSQLRRSGTNPLLRASSSAQAEVVVASIGAVTLTKLLQPTHLTQHECGRADERAFVSEARAHHSCATRVVVRGRGCERLLHEVDVVVRYSREAAADGDRVEVDERRSIRQRLADLARRAFDGHACDRVAGCRVPGEILTGRTGPTLGLRPCRARGARGDLLERQSALAAHL